MRKTATKKTRTGSSVSRPPGDSMETRVSMAMAHGLRTGDTFTLTSGREVYPMGDGGLLEIGPLQATVTVREGESPPAAYERARGLVEVLYQAEFQIKVSAYKQRKKELDG